MKSSVTERPTKNWGVPENLITDMPLITINADKEVYVENHKGILSFDEDCIMLSYRGGALAVCGSKMCIKYMNAESILIYGHIRSVEFR